MKTVKTMQMITGYNQEERPKGDFYATPEVAIRKLMVSEDFGKRILEPCCGNGAISRIVETYGHDVKSRDLYDWGYGKYGNDFLKGKTNEEILEDQFDAIITNPPFCLF